EIKDRTLILDATHNPEGAEMLEENLQRLVGEIGKKPVIVAGTLGEDRGRSLMEVAVKYAEKLYLLAPAQDRALSTDALAELIPRGFQGPVVKDTIERLFSAPYRCTVGSPGDTIVITGSLYLIGEVLQHLQGIPDSGLQDKI
ncbi:MAG: bifunctional folylpolyglutamate synthase/dihydrofolate synthase, partial [Verrucomicrobiota bacterium]